MSFNKYYPAKKYRWADTPLYFFKEMLEARRANEKDNVILVTGSRGDGKTTFTGKILFQFPNFDPYEALVYTKEGFFKQLKKKYDFVWADEGVVNAAKGNVMTRANKLLFEGLTINRDNYNIIFFLMPFVEDFDSKILQYCSAWVHIDSKGIGVLMLPSNKGLFGKRNWDIDAMKKMFDEFQKENKKAVHAPYWIYPNFRGYIYFRKMTIGQETIVKEIKALRKNENLDLQQQQEITVEVKEMENYQRYSAKKLSEMIVKGDIRSLDSFKATCIDMKLDPEAIIRKCDAVLRRNNIFKTCKQLFKEMYKIDTLIKF
jgi:hypothetical protein